MTEKSNAERLADSAHLGYRVGWQRQAAAELRRIPELERQRDELLEALKLFVWPHHEKDTHSDTERQEIGRAAITRAESTNG